jgi:hypothetical protein
MGDSTPEFRSHLGGATSDDRGASDIFLEEPSLGGIAVLP